MNRPEAGGRRASPGSVRRDFHPWNDPAAKPLVEFRNVTKCFGTVTAVDRVDLEDGTAVLTLAPRGAP